MKRLATALLVATLAGCDPVTLVTGLIILDELGVINDETDHFTLGNEPNEFYRSADHHDYQGTEVYYWQNCGNQAILDAEVQPSCPNDVYVDIFDAEGTQVFNTLLCAHDCGKKVDWPPMPTDIGVPGVWRIEMVFDLEAVEDLQIHIFNDGPCLVEVTGTDIDDPDSDDNPDHPGTPYVCWDTEETDDRDVEETYTFPSDGGGAPIQVIGDSITAGSVEVIICDDDDDVVYQGVIDEDTLLPFTDISLPGTPGEWKVTFCSTGLTSQGVEILCEGDDVN